MRQQIDGLATDFADLGPDLRWTLVRGLIHQAIHFAAEREDIEFCAIATYLADMVGHAHELMHDNEPTQPPRKAGALSESAAPRLERAASPREVNAAWEVRDGRLLLPAIALKRGSLPRQRRGERSRARSGRTA